MKVKAYMLTCDRRRETLAQTVSRLGETDWGGPPTVICDSMAIESRGLQCGRPQSRQEMASRFVLETALGDAGLEYLLFLEDDLDFNRHLRHNLDAWKPLAEGLATYATLYNPKPGYWAPAKESAEHWQTVDVNCVYGSQAVLLSRRACEYIVTNWERRPAGMQDIIFSRMAFEFDRRPLFVHTPSLVEHVGGESTWGGAVHTAVDFERDFRAPGL